MSKYKVGTTLISQVKTNGGLKGTVKTGKVIAHDPDGEAIIEVIEVGIPNSPTLRVGDLVRKDDYVISTYYEVKPEFFRVGSSYKYRDGCGSSAVHYLVEELYENENPVYDSDALQALALRKNSEGRSHRVLLSAGDFKYLTKI